MAQAAVEAAHLEEDALLWAGGELAAGGALEVLGQPEAWSQDTSMSNRRVGRFTEESAVTLYNMSTLINNELPLVNAVLSIIIIIIIIIIIYH